jgi:hypothetical protein
MYSCNELFVVTKSDRSITHTGVEEIVVKCVGQKLELLQPSQRVSIICTRLEVSLAKSYLRGISLCGIGCESEGSRSSVQGPQTWSR